MQDIKSQVEVFCKKMDAPNDMDNTTRLLEMIKLLKNCMIVPIQIQFTGVQPEKKSEFAAGYDLFCNDDIVTIPGNSKQVLASTGTAMAIPRGYYGKIESRSSVALKMNAHTGAGVIDSDYRGEVKVLIRNLSNETVTFKKGERIAQLIIMRHETVEFVKCDTLPESVRSEGGFGSTGK
jgi:dUTP pyrophosphatase